MQYPYLTISHLILILFFAFLVIVILYFILKKLDKSIGFKQTLKAILLYDFLAILVYSAYPWSMLLGINSEIPRFLITGTILFFIFYFVLKKFLQINWKQSLTVFLLLIIIIFPIIDRALSTSLIQIRNISIFQSENERLANQLSAAPFTNMFFTGNGIPLFLKIFDKIQGGIFWTEFRNVYYVIMINR